MAVPTSRPLNRQQKRFRFIAESGVLDQRFTLLPNGTFPDPPDGTATEFSVVWNRWSAKTMKLFQGADEMLAMVHRLLSSRGVELVQQNQLRCVFHKLEAEMKGGSRSKASRKRVTELIAEISKIVCEELLRK
jgi:hypothetical protein